MLLAPAGAALAAPTWLAPFDPLPASTSQIVPVMNAGGDVLFADRVDLGAGKLAFRVAARPPGGSVGAPSTFPPAGSTTLGFSSSLALADDGHAILAWVDAGTAFFALRSPSGTWGAPVAVPGSFNVTAARVGIDASGAATLAWAENSNPSPSPSATNNWDVKVARISPAGFVGGSQTLLSSGGPSSTQAASVASVQVAGSGAALVVPNVVSQSIFVAETVFFRDGPTGAFGNPADFDGSFNPPRFAVGDSGRAAVAVATGANIALRVREPGGALGAPVNIGAGGNASNAFVGVAGNGAITLVWDLQVDADPRVLACTATPTDCIGDPQRLSAPIPSLNLTSMAVSATGAALVAWHASQFSPTVISGEKAAVRPPGSATFAPEQEIAPPPVRTATVAVDAAGDGVAVLDVGSGATPVYKAAGFDAAGPRIDSFTAPGSVAQGARAGFAGSASDVWSPVALGWSFGDGASASGGSVSHAFGTAGAFPVTLTATDAVGNSSSRSASVGVRDTVKPRIEKLTLTHKRFRVGPRAKAKAAFVGSGAATAAKRRARLSPIGTTFHFAVSEAGSARFQVDRVASGRRVGRACKKPSHANRRRRACNRYVHAGTLTQRSVKRGSNAFAFSGRIGRKALAPGSYRVTLVVTDRARNASKPRTITFAIVKR